MPSTPRDTASHGTTDSSTLRGASPDTDHFIAHRYSLKNPKDRALNRTALSKELGWTADSHMRILIPLALTDDAGRALVEKLLPAFAEHDVQVLVLGQGAEQMPKTKHVTFKTGSEGLFHQALAGVDAVILPGSPSPSLLPQALVWRYGAVPIVALESSVYGAADNYDPVMESGTSFLFTSGSVWSMHAAVVRALETYRLPYDWRGIQRNGMELGWGV